MAKYLLKSCCGGCGSLRTGTIISGVGAIILCILGIILTYVKVVQLRTIVFDFLDDWIVNIIVTINMVMTIILSIVMLIGVKKRNWYLMLPWIVLGGMLAIALLVALIINAVHFYMEGRTIFATVWLVLGLIAIVIYCYMWYVSFSYFANLREESGRGSYSKDPFRRQRI